MKHAVLIIFILITGTAFADLASTSYVSKNIETRVDTSENANQTMQGTYHISGVMTVETPPLPPMPEN